MPGATLDSCPTHAYAFYTTRYNVMAILMRPEWDRFLTEIGRAARARSESEALELADEALPLDNEALERTEHSTGVGD